MNLLDFKEKQIKHPWRIVTLLIVAAGFAWAILPMLILRVDYVFTIHDGLDSYAAMTQSIHDNHMYFRLWDNISL